MATLKSYTDVEQSRKLAEILPLESADMSYIILDFVDKDNGEVVSLEKISLEPPSDNDTPCWSLAALLGVASTYCSRLEITIRVDKKYNVFAVKDNFVFRGFADYPDGFYNLVDACVVMIEKLHELNLL